MAYQPVTGNPGQGQTPYPLNTQSEKGAYPISDNPPAYPANPNPPYNPNYDQAAQQPLNASYQNLSPAMQYAGTAPQPTANVVALNSVPTTNTSWGGNYRTGWYRTSTANRKKAMIIIAACFGIIMVIIIIVFFCVLWV